MNNFGNYKYISTSTFLNTESLSVNPWSPLTEQEQRAESAQTMELMVGYSTAVEDEQNFDYISRYHAPIR